METPGIERRQFWTDYMERSHALLASMARYPVEECGEGFVSMREAVAAGGVEMLFSTTLLAGRFERLYFIRSGLIDSLLEIGRAMNQRGWILKIEEGYRTREMQIALGRAPAVFDKIVAMCRWECDGERPPLELVSRRASCLVANYALTGTHLFGAAVDISVFRRDDGTEVDRGAPYLHMSELTPMSSPFVGEEAYENRMAITEMMERHGFLHYPGEFWHYNQGDALYQIMTESGRPGRYGPVHWDVSTNSVTPFEEVAAPLTSPEEMQREIEAALARLGD